MENGEIATVRKKVSHLSGHAALYQCSLPYSYAQDTVLIVCLDCKNFPDRGMALRGTAVHFKPSFWRLLTPGLAGQSGTVSFQSIANTYVTLAFSCIYIRTTARICSNWTPPSISATTNFSTTTTLTRASTTQDVSFVTRAFD